MKHLDILHKLNSIFDANFYLVGGFVRDMLAGISTDDYDIATDLNPQNILEIAELKNIKAIPTGIKHGTVTLFLDNKALEITTFRKDLENNGRHCRVEFTKSIKEDSLRRDFTINALYLDANNKLYDFHAGQDDLKKGRLRFIGKPEERINEDYLRILRFFRFFADFDKGAISLRDATTKQALANNAEKIKELSADRVSQEFIKLAKSKNYTNGFAAMANIEQLANLFSLNSQTLNAKDIELTSIYPKFTKLCFIYRNNLQDLLQCDLFNWSNKQKALVKSLIKAKSVNLNEDNLIKSAVVYGKQQIEFCLVANYLAGDLIKIELLENLDIINSPLPEFKVKGADLIALGFKADKQLGETLKNIKQYWLSNGFASKQKCLDFASKLLENKL